MFTITVAVLLSSGYASRPPLPRFLPGRVSAAGVVGAASVLRVETCKWQHSHADFVLLIVVQ
jgi:hypothetical protein